MLEGTFLDLFSAQALRTPDNIAVADRDSSLTYKELEEKSSALAFALVEDGVDPDDFVIVEMPRVKEFVVAAIGVMKAGAAYVPMDPSYPEDRKKFLLEDSGAGIVITPENIASYCSIQPAEKPGKYIRATSEGLAYMIYTSGTTGKPKGVMVQHRSYLNYLNFYVAQQKLTASDRMACHRNFCFDASLEDLFPILTVGGSLHIMPEEIRTDLKAIGDFIIDRKITCVSFTTSLGVMLLEEYPDLPLRYMVVSGERLNPLRGLKVPLWNFYGPTECTVDCVTHLVDPQKDCASVPIGNPVPGCTALILDKEGNEILDGEEGELCIAGVQVAKGYWKRPELTAEKFTFRDGERLYHTGDIVRKNSGGLLEYVGREDGQVKIRGFRVEPGEIEAAARSCEGVGQVAVRVESDTVLLYYVSRTASFSEETLKENLSGRLPEYMLPSVYVRLESIPLNSNGKVDYGSLPEPDFKGKDAPKSPEEEKIYGIAKEIMPFEGFGVETNLVSAGLTSILAMKLSARILRNFGRSLKMSRIFDNPTVRSLAALISDGKEASEESFGQIHPLQEYYPLSPNQLGVYLDWDRNKEGLQYNIPFAARLAKGTDPERLRACLKDIFRAHPVLNMQLAAVDGEIVQRRREGMDPEVGLETVESVSAEFFQSLVRPFDLFKDNLYRACVYSCKGSCCLFLDIHHIISDGISQGLLLSEIENALKGAKPEKESYTAFDHSLEWDRYTHTEAFRADGEYFNSLVSGREMTAYPSCHQGEGKGASRKYGFSIEDKDILKACQKTGVTENVFFLYSLFEVLRRICRDENPMLVTISNGRSCASMLNCQGFFPCTVPAVGTDNIHQLQEQLMESIDRQYYPFTELVESKGLHPQIMYVYEGETGEDDIRGGIYEEKYPVALDTVKVPLTLFLCPYSDGTARLEAEYDDSLYSEDEIASLLRAAAILSDNYAGALLASGDADPEIRTLPVTTPQEDAELLRLGAGESTGWDLTRTTVALFIEQARKTPRLTAVADGSSSSFTYGELDRLSAATACYLREEKQVRPGDNVVVMMPRVKEFIAAALGIMRAGAAYVPVDPAYPQERRSFIIEDSSAKAVITLETLEGIIGWYGSASSREACLPVDYSTADGAAYVIYTSGSTGKPKGVMYPHRGLVNLLHTLVDIYELKEGDALAEYASFCFDMSADELYAPLIVGAQVHIVPDDMRLDLDRVNSFFRERHIKGLTIPTAVGMEMLNNFDLPLEYILLGGEKMLPVRKSALRIFNEYGPTECQMSHFYELDQDRHYDNIPIGRPLPNTISLILDKEGHLLPKGAAGELCQVGPQVALGYWHREELTAEKFVDCPLLPGRKMYHTGDLCRWNEEGDIECLGRIDSQVKIRGFRVEPGEIEIVAAQCEGIGQAVVLIRNESVILYYTVQDRGVSEEALNSFLAERLPEYMVPSRYVRMESLPLNSNGKVDRKALPSPEAAAGDAVPPQNAAEQQIYDIVCQNLSCSGTFGVTTDLISVGMTSISAMRIAMKAGQAFGKFIKVTDFMGSPTVRGLSALLSAQDSAEKVFGKAPQAADTYPLTSNQLGLYIDWENNRDCLQYNMPGVLKIREASEEKLIEALKAVVNAHPVFKARLAVRDGEVVQVRRDAEEPNMSRTRIADAPKGVADEVYLKEYFKTLARPFDLFNDNLYRFVVCTYKGEIYLFADIHHILSDGLSYGMFLHELDAALSGVRPVAEKYTAFDFALEASEYEKTDAYRKDGEYFLNLIGGRRCTQLPGSVAVEPSNPGRGTSHSVYRNFDFSSGYAACSSQGLTSSSWILFLLLEVIRRWTGEKEPMIVSISNGRVCEEVMKSYGFFPCTLPTLWEPDPVSMQHQMFDSISHQAYPFTAMVERTGIHPQIMYVFNGGLGLELDEDSLVQQKDNLSPSLDTVKVPLTVFVYPHNDNVIELEAEYDDSIYSRKDMETLLDSIVNLSENCAEILLRDKTLPDISRVPMDLTVEKRTLNPAVLAVKKEQKQKYVAPATNREAVICYLLEDFLGIPKIGVTESLKQLGMNSMTALRMAVHLGKKGVKVRVEDIFREDNVRGIAGSVNKYLDRCAYWMDGYKKGRKTVVMCSGVTSTYTFVPKLASLSKKYNIYILEPLFNAWPDYENLNYEEVLDRFSAQIEKDVPTTDVEAFFGFSYGGLMAYNLACRFSVAHGYCPFVLLGDSAAYHLDHKAETENIENVDKRIALELLYSCLDHIGYFPVGDYAGKVTLISASSGDGYNEYNERIWKEACGNLEIIRVPVPHADLILDEKNYALYERLISGE